MILPYLRHYLRRLYRTAIPLLFARRRFKLFMRAAVEDIESRTLALASQADYFSGFVTAIPIRAPFGDSMLVVAPHQDDEAIGCGGVLALQARSGRAASIVILVDGSGEEGTLGITREALVEMRNQESRRCAAVIGLEPPVFLNCHVLADEAPQATAAVLDMIRRRKVDAIFVPFVLDGHPDHRTANRIVASALRDIPWNVRVFGYEVWGLCIPNVIVVIDEVIEEKLRMISCFDFANKGLDYVSSTKGLNMYHSRMLGAGECQYAERFFEIPRAEYVDLVEKVEAAPAAASR